MLKKFLRANAILIGLALLVFGYIWMFTYVIVPYQTFWELIAAMAVTLLGIPFVGIGLRYRGKKDTRGETRAPAGARKADDITPDRRPATAPSHEHYSRHDRHHAHQPPVA